MGEKRVRVDKVVANAMHFPAVGSYDDPMFLYTKVPEYNGANENIESGYAKNAKYSEWVSAKEKVYSSPRNIRAVYMYDSGVEVLTFKPPFGMKVARHGRKYGTSIDRENAYGNALSALSKPLVCSNIEEVYIDVSLVSIAINTSDELRDSLARMGISIGEINNILGAQAILESKLPEALLSLSNGSVFNRVRTVAITNGLFTGLEGKFLQPANEKNSYARSYELSANEIRQSGASMLISRIDKNNKNYGNLSTAPNIYLYDRNILSEAAERFASTFGSAVAEHKEAVKEQAQAEKSGEYDQLKALVAGMRSNYGDRLTDKIVKSALSTMNKVDRDIVENVIYSK